MLLFVLFATFARAELAPDGQELYSRLTTLVSRVDRSVLESLNGRSFAAPQNAILLRTVGVGVKTSFSIGLGPIFKLTAEPEIRLFYTRDEEPLFP